MANPKASDHVRSIRLIYALVRTNAIMKEFYGENIKNTLIHLRESVERDCLKN